MDKAKFDRQKTVGILRKCRQNALVGGNLRTFDTCIHQAFDKTPLSIYEVSAILDTAVCSKTPIRELLSQNNLNQINQKVKEQLSLF